MDAEGQLRQFLGLLSNHQQHWINSNTIYKNEKNKYM